MDKLVACFMSTTAGTMKNTLTKGITLKNRLVHIVEHLFVFTTLGLGVLIGVAGFSEIVRALAHVAGAELDFGIVSFIVGIFIIWSGVISLRALRGKPQAALPQLKPADKTASNADNDLASNTQFDSFIMRSEDILSSLADLTSHGKDIAPSEFLLCLERSKLLEWKAPMPLSATRLSRSGRWWIAFNSELFDRSNYDKLIMLESMLNISSDAGSIQAPTEQARLMKVLANTSTLQAEANTTTIKYLLGDNDGEWAYRLRFSDYVENAKLGFRLDFELVANTAEGVVDIRIEVPRPECFLPFAQNPTQQTELARDYALRLALLCGRFAFEAGSDIVQAQIRCYVHKSTSELMSLHLTKADLDRLLAAVTSAHPVSEQLFIDDPAISARFRKNGWFASLGRNRKLLPFELLDPPSRHKAPELIREFCSPEVHEATGARYVSDLGINENAGRISEWNQLVMRFDSSTEEAVSKLVKLRNETQDLSIAEACERTSKALVEGNVDIGDKSALAQIFAYGSALDTAVAKAEASFEEPDPSTAEEAITSLEEVLAPIMQTGLYLDDSENIYRYFNSMSDRVAFNLDVDDHSRNVKLVPDAYYKAHSLAARLLGLMNREDEALPHIDELMRIAPSTTDAILIKVRWLENNNRVFEAADLLMEGIRKAPTAHDMAVCHYRLAYMEWKLGRSDLAVACYERAVNLRQHVSLQAEIELQDLLAGDKKLSRHNNEEEVIQVLEEAQIPYGPIGDLRKRIVRAAKTTADANIFMASRQLTATLLELGRDDALVDTYRSLSSELRSTSPTGYDER